MSGLETPNDERFTGDTRELFPTADGCGRHIRKCGRAIGIPLNDKRFWPDGKAPGKWVRTNVPAMGEGEG